MVAVNQEDLIGTLLPNVYIKRITLETSGLPLVERDPHIGHDRENLSLQNAAQQELSNKTLKVSLDLLLKEKLSNDVIGSWFSNQDIEKYLVIKVFQSTDPQLTEVLSAGSDAVNLIDPSMTVPTNDILYQLAYQKLEVSSPEDLNERLERVARFKKISIAQNTEGNNSNIYRFKSYVDDNGNKNFNITYRTEFSIENSNPDHLSYFAVCSFDIEAITEDFNLKVDNLTIKKMNGKMTSDIVIDNKKVVSKTYVYYDPETKVWAGPVHKQGNKWFSKSSPQPNSVPLIRTLVKNTKIQDFRVRNNIKRILDFSFVDEQLSDLENNKLSNGSTGMSYDRQTYFSEMYISRDKDGRDKFFFSVDLESAVRYNSLFGRLMDKPNLGIVDVLVQNCYISSMNIYRRRVKEDASSNSAGNITGISVFDNNEPWQLIVSSGETEWRKFQTVNNNTGTITERRIRMDENYQNVRHFSGMDKSMSLVSDGLYQYVVEIEITDSTVEYIKQKIRALSAARKQLQEYLSLSTDDSMSRYLYEARDPHIDSPREYERSEGQIAGSYDLASNSFTQYFINLMNEKYPNPFEAPWNTSAAIYADALHLFTGVLANSASRNEILTTLSSYLAPSTGNPTGIATVIELIEQMVAILKRTIGTADTAVSDRYPSNSSQIPSGQNLAAVSKRTFKITHAFDTVFDSNEVKGVGIDYLSSGKDNTPNVNGLRVVTGQQYAERINLETLRFYKTKNPSIDLIYSGEKITEGDSVRTTQFGYLTPSRVDLPKQSVLLIDSATFQTLDIGIPETNRTVRSISEEGIEPAQKFYELQSIIFNHSSIEQETISKTTARPVGGNGFGVVGEGSATQDPVKISREKTYLSYKELGSIINMSFEPIKTETSTDSDGNILINVVEGQTENTDLQISEPPVDEIVFETEQNNNLPVSVEKEMESVSLFMSTLLRPAMQNGSFKKSERQLRRPNFNVESGPQAYNKSPFIDAVEKLNKTELTVEKIQSGNTEELKVISGLNQVISEEQFKMFPNQIKAIFLQGTGASIVRNNKRVNILTKKLKERQYNRAQIDFSYGMINEIQFLDGYEHHEQDGVQKPLISNPIWRNLTESDFTRDTLEGQLLLCRMKPYENGALGIKPKRGFEVSVYDEHFFLIPSTFVPLENELVIPEQTETPIVEAPPTVEAPPIDQGELLAGNTGTIDITDVGAEFGALDQETVTTVVIQDVGTEIPGDILQELVSNDIEGTLAEPEFYTNNTPNPETVFVTMQNMADSLGQQLIQTDNGVVSVEKSDSSQTSITANSSLSAPTSVQQSLSSTNTNLQNTQLSSAELPSSESLNLEQTLRGFSY